MQTSRPSVRNVLPVALAGALLLSACATDEQVDGPSRVTSTTTPDEGGSEDTSPATNVTDTARAEPAPTDPPATIPAETDPPSTEPVEAGECLVGEWELRSQEFLDQISEAVDTGDVGVTAWTHTGGRYLLTMASDGSYVGERQEWQFKIATDEGAVVMTISSNDPGTYGVDGSTIEFVDTGSEATVTMQLEVGGTLTDMPFVPGSSTVDTPGVSGSGSFTCEGDVLTSSLIDEGFPDGVDATFDRIG